MTKKSQMTEVEHAPHVESKGDSFGIWLVKAVVASIVMVAVSIMMVAIVESRNTSPEKRAAVPEAWRGGKWASAGDEIVLDIPLDVGEPIEVSASLDWGRLQAFPSAVSADGRRVECLVKCWHHGQPVGRLELEARGKNKIHCIFSYRDEQDNPGQLARLLSKKKILATL